MDIKWIGSPNFDKNRKSIDRIVIHWFGAGKLKGADAQFQKPNGTSAHYGIEDAVIHQYVKEENVAYHAGNYPMNQRSIGIEHSAEPNRPASEATYQSSAQLVREICNRYSIPLNRDHIIKHSEVKATQCPGTMDIDKIISLAKQDNMIPENITRKSSAFDKLISLLFKWGKLDKDNSDIYSYQDVAKIITDIKDDRDKQADRATRWDKLCNYLGFQDSVATPYEQVQSSIAGLKSQITTLQNKVVPLESELKNREEQVSRLKGELLESERLRMELVKKLGEAMSGVPTTVKVYEDRIKGMQGTIDTQAREVGSLKTELSQCQTNTKKTFLKEILELIKKLAR